MAAKKNPRRVRTGPTRRGRTWGATRPGGRTKGRFVISSGAITSGEKRTHEQVAGFEAMIADLKARIWRLPVDAFSGGSDEKRKAHNTLKMSIEHLKAAKAQVKAAAVAAREITRRVRA